jgi:flagellar hook assembly protein FlgD
LQAVRTGTADVKESGQAEAALTITPNPSQGDVNITVSNALIRQIAVYDVLGNVVAERANTATWLWNGESNNGTASAAGTYFIRAEGVTTGGKTFVSTQKLLLRK